MNHVVYFNIFDLGNLSEKLPISMVIKGKKLKSKITIKEIENLPENVVNDIDKRNNSFINCKMDELSLTDFEYKRGDNVYIVNYCSGGTELSTFYEMKIR